VLLEKNEFSKLSAIVNQEHNPVKYLGIDPGGSNGVCGYDAKFYLIFMYTIKAADMIDFLDQFKTIDECVIEDYLLYPNKSKEQVYSDMETSRIIGRVEYWAERHDVKLIKQGASIKKTGYAWIGRKPLPKSNPFNHELDAHVHFMYWAVRNGKVDARKLITDD
jgi:hypothetical protein